MPVVQVDFGRNAMDRARETIRDGIERATLSVMAGQFTEGEYRFKAGHAYGLQQALNAMDEAEKAVAQEK